MSTPDMSTPDSTPPAVPPPATQQFPGEPGGPGTRSRDPLAVVTLLLGLVGFLVITIPAALILGVATFARIGRTGRRGRGLAAVGLTLAVLWAAGFGVAAVVALDAEPTRNGQGKIEKPGDVRPDRLKVGDCVTGISEGVVTDVRAVPCGEADNSKVFAVFELTEPAWPGEAKADNSASEGCVDRYQESSRKPGEEVDVIYIRPTPDSWKFGDRTVVCVAVPTA